MPLRLSAARRAARTGRNGSVAADGPQARMAGPHSVTAGVRPPASRCVERVLVGGGCLVELGRSGGSPISRVDLGGGPPHLDRFDERSAGPAAGRHPVGQVGRGPPDLGGEVGDEVGAGLQVGTPVGMVGELGGDAGQPGQRPGAGGCGGVGGRGRRPGRSRSRAPAAAAAACRVLDGVVSVGVEEQQVGAQGGPGRFAR